MSVLSVPRIFFQGFAQWNPNTANNNDQWSTFDFVHAAINWDFLQYQFSPTTQMPPVTHDDFVTWMMTLQEYDQATPTLSYQLMPPAEWNYFGGYETLLYDTIRNQPTRITGGQLNYGAPPTEIDPVVGATVNMWGDAYPGSTTPTACRLVDVNADAFWSTLFLVRRFQIGDATNPARYLSGEVKPGSVMSTRWMALQRNLNLDQHLGGSGIAGIVLQACLPNETLRITAGGSDLLEQLDAARQGVAGVMVRLYIYITEYFLGREFADCVDANGQPDRTKQYRRLVQLWTTAIREGRAPIRNPTVSRVVGTFGLWMEDELVAQPGGRYLLPSDSIVPPNIPPDLLGPPGTQVVLGPAAAELHTGNQPSAGSYLSLDLGGTIPETDASGAKVDFGPLTVAVQTADGQKTIGTIPAAAYAQKPYEATAGIIDLPLPADLQAQDVLAGTLLLQAGGATLLSETAVSSQALTAESDQRGIYVDEGQVGVLMLQVRQKGAVPTEPVNVLLQIYLPVPRPPLANGSAWSQPAVGESPIITFDHLPDNIVTVNPGDGGIAQVSVRTLEPGSPIVVFFPYRASDPPPTPPSTILPVFQQGSPLSMFVVGYTCVRAMPFDNGLPAQFAQLWNRTHDQNQAWQFVYDNILSLYALLYPAMKYYAGLDLSNKDVVDDTIDLILQLTSVANLDRTTYMPITRDLSAGKRTVLEMYGSLVQQNWKVQNLTPST